ncbi:unnamed protein product [Penicillium olsonii]|uniref:Fido domain-containing protein n=1 Tax=Penicillium olsonii TaxID=99116 RepID=A0A9W4HYN1_PENOL|nr:unnamed protein product [Penicillium olsonii]CAG8168652.1 unnamed protein product [Penicillium olsonii]
MGAELHCPFYQISFTKDYYGTRMAYDMNSPTQECASFWNIFDDWEITSQSASTPLTLGLIPISLPKAIKEHMESTMLKHNSVTANSLHGVKGHLTISMEEAYDYKIAHEEFDPEVVYPEVVQLGNQISNILEAELAPEDECAFEEHIVGSLAAMVYGIFKDENAPEQLGEDSEEFRALEHSILHKGLPTSKSAILRSRVEIIQHAKAASFLITQLCLHDKDLSERAILQKHGILTYKVDADEVSAGFHTFPAPALVPSKMKAMISDLEYDLSQCVKRGTIDPISLAAKYAHIFINIHPFIDGNGRMCRLILNAMLLKFGSFLVCLGAGEEERRKYLEIAADGSALEDLYEDAEEDEKPKLHKQLSSFVLDHVKEDMKKLIDSVSGPR